MSAVLKPVTEQEEPKTLTELCVIADTLPVDFYDNSKKYEKQLDAALATAKSLIHSIDDEGRKKAKNDVALIRSLAKSTNQFSLSTFRTLTDKVKLWRDGITDKTKALNDEADAIMSRFEKMEQAKIESIKQLVLSTLAEHRKEIGVRREFIKQDADISSIVKLTGTLTAKGELTTKALGFIKTIGNDEIYRQDRHDKRLMVLEVRCLREEINPPLDYAYMGQAFSGSDEEFNAKLEELVKIELDRRAETVARIERQNKADNQKKIDDALAAQQAEANRLAKEAADKEAADNREKRIAEQAEHDELRREILKQKDLELNQRVETVPVKTPAQLRESAGRIEECAQRADSGETRRRELAQASELRKEADDLENTLVKKETRTVVVTARFELPDITSKFSDADIASMFEEMLPQRLKDRLKKVLFTSIAGA